MTADPSLRDPRIPEIGSVPQALRMFRVNWIASELRSPSGVPMHSPDYVSRLGRAAHLVDVRTPEELTGPLGYIPGSVWVPREEALARLSALDPDTPVVIVSRGGERAGELAKSLEARGHRFVAALMGGVVAWRQVGFSTSRDPRVLERRGELLEVDPVWVPRKRVLTRDDIAEHVGDACSLRWIKLAAMLVTGRLSCVDGRDDAGVIGTPGGDAGEFLLGLAALERVAGVALDDAAVHALLLRRIDAFGRFYLHTDVHASNASIKSMRADRRLDEALAHVYEPLEWRRFLREPPEAVRDVVLEHIVVPEHMGCGHLRLSLQRSEAYGVRPELVRATYRHFLSLRWQGVEENEIAVLPGGHAEGAVVRVLLEDGAEAFSDVPLVSPMAAGSQMFLCHPQVSGFLRGQMVRFLARQHDLVPLPRGAETALVAEIERLGDAQLSQTLAALAPGLPIFDVTFGRGGVVVSESGAVSAPT
ncbi:MAG: rhodanese-like domain-containing protein [Polyangiales bacterium]